jgi:hypothetical protein
VLFRIRYLNLAEIEPAHKALVVSTHHMPTYATPTLPIPASAAPTFPILTSDVPNSWEQTSALLPLDPLFIDDFTAVDLKWTGDGHWRAKASSS